MAHEQGSSSGSSSTESRLWVRLDHVAVAVPDVKLAALEAVRRFGCLPNRGYVGHTFHGIQCHFRNGTKLEAISPPQEDGDNKVDEQNFVRRFLAQRRTVEGPVAAAGGSSSSTNSSAPSAAAVGLRQPSLDGRDHHTIGSLVTAHSGIHIAEIPATPETGASIHHITFYVRSLAGACDKARLLGYGVVGVNDSSPTWKEAFIHPKSTGAGILVQLAEVAPYPPQVNVTQRPRLLDGVDDALLVQRRSDSEEAEMKGLVLSTTDMGRLRRLFCDMLEGYERFDKPRVFYWHDSALRIRVVQQGFDGPVGLEMSNVCLPYGTLGHAPEIGARFLLAPDYLFIEDPSVPLANL